MKFRKSILVVLVFAVILGLVVGGALWQIQRKAFGAEKAAFLKKYQATMEKEIQDYFFAFEELPGESQELVAPGVEIRQPWVMNGIVKFGFNRPSIREGWMAFEVDVFQQTIPVCQAKLPEWKRELAAARKPLLELDGDLPAQLDLFLDRTFDARSGYSFLEKLQEEQNVSEEALLDFMYAFVEVRSIEGFRQWAGQIVGSPEWDSPDLAAAVDARAGQELELALREFRRARNVVLEQAE